MRETWYVLEDGSVADPAECAVNDKGKLAHNGVPVAMRGDAYSSRSVEVDAKDMRPARTGKGYKTRDAKAD